MRVPRAGSGPSLPAPERSIAAPSDDLPLEFDLPDEGKQDLWVDLVTLARALREDGRLAPPEPVAGFYAPNEPGLFYRGLNTVAGHPGAGKSMLGQLVVRDAVRAGRYALILNSETPGEEGDAAYLARLISDLDFTEEDLARVSYLSWESGVVPTTEEIIGATQGRHIDFVLVDSLSEAMNVRGLDEKDARAVTLMLGSLERLQRRVWPDVSIMLVDGRVKNWTPGEGWRAGSGSARKLYKVEAQYLILERWPSSRDQDGHSVITATKDRHGTYTKGQKVALLRMGPGGIYLAAHDDTEDQRKAEEQARREEAEDDAVLAAVGAAGGRTQSDGGVNPTADDLTSRVAAEHRDGVKAALARLAEAGKINSHRPASTGTRGGQPKRYYLP